MSSCFFNGIICHTTNTWKKSHIWPLFFFYKILGNRRKFINNINHEAQCNCIAIAVSFVHFLKKFFFFFTTFCQFVHGVVSCYCLFHYILVWPSFSSIHAPLASSCHLWTWTSGLALTWTTGYCCRVGRSPTKGRHAAMLLRRSGSNVPMVLDRHVLRRSASSNLRTSTSACTGRRR